MIYSGVIVPYDPELSRVSYDPTPLRCENEGCGAPILQPLVVPGELIGRPGRTYRVVRCLNCIFWGAYVTYFEGESPVRVVFDPEDAECHDFLQTRKEDAKPNVASLQWRLYAPGSVPDLEDACNYSLAGGEPIWLQEPVEMICPTCAKPMEFLLQFSSSSIDPYFRAPELQAVFFLKIEYYATLYQFQCESCNLTASITQCT